VEGALIICSCNVLSEAQILATLETEGVPRPRTAGQAYRCLGCAPRCGRCVQTVRALIAKAQLTNCQVGCTTCPAGHSHPAQVLEEEPAFLLAAE
jgi:bacterioferritin-associated ferredoxin